MEETLSTLNYAMHAKSVRNKPELNQRMTRNALLKEYVVIERLKADVLAAREKNGIFLSEDTWKQLSSDKELQQTEMEEATKQVEIAESQMGVREEFEQSLALLTKRDGELSETKDRLKEIEGELVVKEEELKVVKGALEEEVVVRPSIPRERRGIGWCCGWIEKKLLGSITDVGHLFDKLCKLTAHLQT
jgi:kinesin family protein 11